jgi:hypothetical protein
MVLKPVNTFTRKNTAIDIDQYMKNSGQGFSRNYGFERGNQGI